MSWRLYGVKTAYRTEAHGRPRHTDSNYDAQVTLVEERVVLVRARNDGEAIRKGKAEARDYVRGMSCRNRYGERVRQRFLGACEVFELFAKPRVGVEVFSTNRLFSRRMSDRAVIDQVVGSHESPKSAARRWRFLDDAITQEFLGKHTIK